jgi:hypothetical protein
MEVPATLQNFKDAGAIRRRMVDFDVTVILRNEAIDFPDVIREIRTTGVLGLLVAGGVAVLADGVGTGIDEKYTAKLRVKVNPIFRTPLAVTDALRVNWTRRTHRSTRVGMMFPSTIWHAEASEFLGKPSVDATTCTCSGEQSLKIVASLI